MRRGSPQALNPPLKRGVIDPPQNGVSALTGTWVPRSTRELGVSITRFVRCRVVGGDWLSPQLVSGSADPALDQPISVARSAVGTQHVAKPSPFRAKLPALARGGGGAVAAVLQGPPSHLTANPSSATPQILTLNDKRRRRRGARIGGRRRGRGRRFEEGGVGLR